MIPTALFNGKPLNVEQAIAEKAEDGFCSGCNKPVRIRKGKVGHIQPHFAHKHQTQPVPCKFRDTYR